MHHLFLRTPSESLLSSGPGYCDRLRPNRRRGLQSFDGCISGHFHSPRTQTGCRLNGPPVLQLKARRQFEEYGSGYGDSTEEPPLSVKKEPENGTYPAASLHGSSQDNRKRPVRIYLR